MMGDGEDLESSVNITPARGAVTGFGSQSSIPLADTLALPSACDSAVRLSPPPPPSSDPLPKLAPPISSLGSTAALRRRPLCDRCHPQLSQFLPVTPSPPSQSPGPVPVCHYAELASLLACLLPQAILAPRRTYLHYFHYLEK